MNKGHGFKADIIKYDDYVFGAEKLPTDILQSDGNWEDFLPIGEEQEKNGLETMNCTSYGTINALETLYNRLYGLKIDKSERYVGVVAETTPQGNTPQNVIQAIRHSGLIDEKDLPFDKTINTWEDYYSPLPMTKKYLKMGEKFLKEFEISHEWLNPITPKSLIKALQCSPLGVSVYAWELGQDGLYIKPEGEMDNHWVCLYGFEEGNYWKIFDSYDNTHKKLVWDYDFRFAKRYHLLKKNGTSEKSRWQKIKEFLEEVLEKITKRQGD